MKVLVHAGLPKTGTSSIQSFLARNRDFLDESQVFSPDIHPNHSLGLSAFFMDDENLIKYKALCLNSTNLTSLKERREYGEKIIDQISKISKKVIDGNQATESLTILSGEEVCRFNLKELERMKGYLSGVASETHILVYVRPYYEFYPSLIQESIKQGGILEDEISRMASNLKRGSKPFYNIVQKLIRVFNDSNVSVRLSTAGIDVVSDFIDFVESYIQRKIQVDYVASSIQNVNSGLRWSLVQVLSEFNQRIPLFVESDTEVPMIQNPDRSNQIFAVLRKISRRLPVKLDDYTDNLLDFSCFESLLEEANFFEAKYGIDLWKGKMSINSSESQLSQTLENNFKAVSLELLIELNSMLK